MLGPAILIALGVIFLLNSLEIVPWSVWGTLGRFWPLILVLIGVEIILRQTRAGWAVSLVASLAVVVLAVGLVAGAAQLGWVNDLALPVGDRVQGVSLAEQASVSRDLNGIREARASIDFGAGKLVLNSLSDAPDKLVVVDYSVGAVGHVPRLNVSQSGAQGNLRISGGQDFQFGRRPEADQWNVHLSPDVPLDLALKLGAAEGNVDLAGLKIKTLQLDVGASNLTVSFPAGAGSSRATVNAGAASLTLEIPAGVGARIVSESGLASINASSRYTKSEGVFTTSDYQTAANRLDIDLKAGVSSVNIK